MSELLPRYPEPLPSERSTLSSKKIRGGLAVVVLMLALGYFSFLAFQSATVYYYQVDELVSLGVESHGKVVRVSGKLVPVSFYRPEGSTRSQFSLAGEKEILKASHDGVLPDLFFNEHSEIILEGRHVGDDLFESYNVIVKCPSKYITDD
jgi:cytochrome c-type biogenesis protein CcmE